MKESGMTEDWKDDPLENTAPVIGSGDFLRGRGYADADEMRVKFYLANRIALLIEDQNLRQADVCDRTGLKQPDVSKIVNGTVSGFSVWRLLLVLKGLGQKVTISVQAPDHERTPPLGMAL
jgi:predicted XRE-type DNA-binding protein